MTITTSPTRLGRAAWCWALFQGGRDPFVILVTIYVFVPYLVTSVIADPVHGQALVAGGAKYAGWIVALTAPLLGAVVDRMGPRKPWLAATVALMAPLMAALWWAKPGGVGLGVGTIIAMLAALSVFFAYTETLHNALLLPAAGMRRAGSASGLALAFGNGTTNFLSLTNGTGALLVTAAGAAVMACPSSSANLAAASASEK